MSFSFRPIDLDRHAELCVKFRRDTYACSFGSDELFERNQPGGRDYISWLKPRLLQFPEGHLHVWRDGKIVGQIEMIPRGDPPNSGYVSLFYAVPELRGSGLGGALHDHVTRLFRNRGTRLLRLSASPTNDRANRFYAKHGWRSLGPRPGREHVHLWELLLEGSEAMHGAEPSGG